MFFHRLISQEIVVIVCKSTSSSLTFSTLSVARIFSFPIENIYGVPVGKKFEFASYVRAN